MEAICRECGALLPRGEECIDYFHSLLLLEYEVADDPKAISGGRGEAAHFYAVSSYVLQHPEGMNYTTEALADLRRLVGDHLAGRITLAEQRRRVHRGPAVAARVTRRAGDEVLRWPAVSWPINVADVLAGGVEGYCGRVAAWAESVLRTLDRAGA
jgi:hypothetical protein